MNNWRRDSGQGLVEFALVFPLILLIVVVFIDLGRIVYYHSALTNAVREGARYAVVHQAPDVNTRQLDVRPVVLKYAVALPLNSNDISVTCDNADCTNYVTVSADMKIDPMVPFMAQIIGSGTKFDVSAESRMLMTPYGSYK